MKTAGQLAISAPEGARELLARALAISTADQTEVVLEEADGALTRFANNHIHQNVAARRRQITARARVGRKIGVAGTSRTDDAGLRTLMERAVEIARLQPDDPNPIELPGPAAYQALDGVASATLSVTPEERARGAARVIAEAR